MCPVLVYCSSDFLHDETGNIQNQSVRFIASNYNYERGSMAGILEKLKREFANKRRRNRGGTTFIDKSEG